MDRITDFIENFLDVEHKTRLISYTQPDQKLYSKAIRNFSQYFMSGLSLSPLFVTRPLTPNVEFFMTEEEFLTRYYKRICFNLSCQKHKEYKQIFNATLSGYECHDKEVAVKMVYIVVDNDKPVITSNYNLDLATGKWIFRGGIKVRKSGKITESFKQ